MEDCGGGGGGGGGRGEEYKSLGGICNSSMLPSNILITGFIEGLLTDPSVCPATPLLPSFSQFQFLFFCHCYSLQLLIFVQL